MEKGSRVVMTPAKSQMIAQFERKRKRRVQKMRHPEQTLRTLNAAIAAKGNVDREYERMFKDEADFDELDKIYHKVNKQPAVSQLGLFDLAQANFMKSKQRFSRQLLVGV